MSRMEQEKTEKTFEDQLEELDGILEQMEEDDVSLEESFELYKKGIACVKEAGVKLDAIEKEMLVLNRDGELEEF